MAKSVTEELLDEITKHSLELQRLANNTSEKWIKKEYGKLSKELADLTRSNEFIGVGTVKSQKKKVQKIIQRGSKSIALMHNDLYNKMQDTLREVGELETHFSVRSVNKAVTGKGSIFIAEKSLSPRQVSSTANKMITQGMPQKEIWGRQTRRVRDGFKDIIRNAYQTSEDMDTTIGHITGTRARGFKDGLMRLSANHADTLARTSILGMSNTIRQETYAANKDVIRGVQFLAHLDRRTTPICRAHSGDKWIYLPDGSMKNIQGGHDFVEPPLHFNCRSTIIPIVKSASSLSPDKLKKVPLLKRKTLGADLPLNKYVSADAWLKTQPENYQKEVLGKAFGLWVRGKVNFQRFVSQKGRVRTPEELVDLYVQKQLVPESIQRLKTTDKFRPYSGATKQYQDELAGLEKGKFLQIEERLMTGKTVSNQQSDLIGRVIKNADPEDLELPKNFSPVDFEDFVGNKGKRLAYYNHTAKRFSRFDKLAKGDLAKRKVGPLNDIDKEVRKELIEKITVDETIKHSNKRILIDMFDESARIVGSQRSLPMVESLLTLSRKTDFSEIKGDFLGYLQRSSENAVNSYFSRVKRFEIRLGQGVEKQVRYATLSDAAKGRHLSAIKAQGNALSEVSAVKKKISKIGSRKLRNFVGDKADELSVNLELSHEATITNYLASIDESRMTNKQISQWLKRLGNKKQQIIIARSEPAEQILLSDKFLNLKEFKRWQDNVWSGRGLPPVIREEVGEVLGDAQIYQNLRQYMKGKILAPKSVIEDGFNADEYIGKVLKKYVANSTRLKLEAYKFDAHRKISSLYKLDGDSRKLLRAARKKKAERDQSGGFFAKLNRKEAKKTSAEKIEAKRAALADDWTKQTDAKFIGDTIKAIDKGILDDVLNPRAPFFREVGLVRAEDIAEVARLTNQEAFRVINSGGAYLDAAKSLGEKFYFRFKGIKQIDEDDAIRMGNFLLVRLEKAKIIDRFKTTSMVRDFDWEPPKEQVMWMLKAKNKNWEDAILANRKNYEFDGLPSLKPPKYDKDGFYETGQAAIRGTHKDEVTKLLKPRKTAPAIKNLDYESATAIKVNGYVYDTMNEMERKGVGIGSAIPKKPTSKLDVAARSTRSSWDRVRKVAKSMKDETFYNGMSNDKYARTYANTIALHWQGDHVNKGLMLFHKGVKMGKYGEDAFKQEFINVALNGFDKLPIKVRKQVYDLMPDKLIADTIKNPLEHSWWYTKTDWFEAGLLKRDLKGISKEWADEIRKLAVAGEPDGEWNFLSLLKERAEQIEWRRRGKKIEDFVSHKQLQVDGTTNVLQHLSGISRDYEMAKRVNMVTQPKVADAYIAVRDQLDTIARRLDDNDPRKKYINQDWLQLPHTKRRKSVKKGLMTYQYNAGPATLGDSYFEALEAVLVNGKPIFKTAPKGDRLAIGRLVAQASDEVFPNSGNVKSLLNNFAEAHEIADKRVIEFSTELGFPFRQQYLKKGVRQLEIPDGTGGTMKLNLSVDLDEMDWSKQNRAFAPNIIHSMDATHKSMVVNKLKEKHGVETFSMIHDSFGSSAGHMKALNLATRETFQELYKGRVFMKELYDSFSKQGVPMKRFVRNETGQKVKYTQNTKLVGKQERFARDGRVWVIEPIPLEEVLDQGKFDFKDFNKLEYFFH